MIILVIQVLSAEEWVDCHIRQLQFFISIYVTAQCKSNNKSYRSISTYLDVWKSEIFESEVKYLSQHGTQSKQLELLKVICRMDNLEPKKKAKYLLKIAELDRPNGSTHCKEAIKILSAIDIGEPSVQSQMAIALCESSISRGVSLHNNATEMLDGLNIWLEILAGVEPFRRGAKTSTITFPHLDLPHLFKYLCHLSEYLQAIANHQLGIFALSLATRVCAICPDIDQSEESFKIYLAISYAYLELGYSGRAGLSLAVAKSFLTGLSSSLVHSFYIAYADYLYSIGNLEKALEIRGKVSEECHEIESLRLLLDSKLSLAGGNVGDAAEKAYSGYQLVLRSLKKTLVSTFKGHKAISLVMAAILTVSRLLSFQGHTGKIDYYLRQGLELALKANSQVWHGIFSVELANLHCKRDDLEESKMVIETAKKDFDSVRYLFYLS